MELELKKWLKYLSFIEPPQSSYEELTQYQKEDIEFTKKKIRELEERLNEKERK
jgi:hypothetical protein